MAPHGPIQEKKAGMSDTHFHGHMLVHTSNLEADIILVGLSLGVVVVGRYIMRDGCDNETDECLIHIVSVCVCMCVGFVAQMN